MTVTVDEFEVADPAHAWTRAGFGVDSGGDADAVCRVGGVGIRLTGRGRRAAPAATLDRGATRMSELGGRPIRQIFFRFGDVIIEVVGSPETASEGPSTLWGITYVVTDIDATASFFGDRTTPVTDAVQPGRRITTLRHHELGMSVRTALISAPASR
jgi:hypothetical protein